MIKETPQLCLDYLIRPPRLNPRTPPALILFPGFLITEADFLRLTLGFDDRFLIISLRPPIQMTGNHVWFAMERIGSAAYVNPVQAEYSRGEAVKFIAEAVQAFKIDPELVYLMGYSQGAVVALSVFLSQPDQVAGLVIISGQVTPEIRALVAPAQKYKGKPVLHIHGIKDPVWPIGIGRAAGCLLASLPVRFESHLIVHMDHALSTEALDWAREWLSKRLDEQGIFGLPELPPYRVSISGAHLKVRNLERAIQFYIRFLGMELVEKTGRAYAFLTNNASHHVIALQNVGDQAPVTSLESAGLHSVRFELASPVEFAQAYKHLTDAGIPVTLIDHLTCWEMHFTDPDGNGIDLFWDTRDLPGKSHLWQGRDLPLDPQSVLKFLEE